MGPPTKHKIDEDKYFLETLSFVMTVFHLEVPLDIFPIHMNCQLNLSLNDFERNGFLVGLQERPPAIVQYNLGTLQMYPTNRTFGEYDAATLQAFPFLRNLHNILIQTSEN